MPIPRRAGIVRLRADVTTFELYEAGYTPLVAGAGETVVTLAVGAPLPSLRLQRWDGATGIRAATPAEVTAWDQARRRERTVAAFDPAIRALAAVLLDEINALRTNAGLPARTAAQFRTAFITQYEALT